MMTPEQAQAMLAGLGQRREAVEELKASIGELQGGIIRLLQSYQRVLTLDLVGIRDTEEGLKAAVEMAQSAIVVPTLNRRGN